MPFHDLIIPILFGELNDRILLWYYLCDPSYLTCVECFSWLCLKTFSFIKIDCIVILIARLCKVILEKEMIDKELQNNLHVDSILFEKVWINLYGFESNKFN